MTLWIYVCRIVGQLSCSRQVYIWIKVYLPMLVLASSHIFECDVLHRKHSACYFEPSQPKSALHQLQVKQIQSQFRSSQVMLAPSQSQSQYKFAPSCSHPLFRQSHPQVNPESFPGQAEADQVNRKSGQTSPKSCQMSPKSSASQTR